MPEPVHQLISEPARSRLAPVLQGLQQTNAHELRPVEGAPFWKRRYSDFNVWGEAKRNRPLRYIRRNPVRRGLARTLGVEQLPSLCHWRREHGCARIPMDGAQT